LFSGRSLTPLHSAVDAHVGRHIFDRCIRGQLQGRTIVVATHQLQYLPQADWVVVLDAGAVKAQGTYADLTAAGVDFDALEDKSDEPATPEAAAAAAAVTQPDAASVPDDADGAAAAAAESADGARAGAAAEDRPAEAQKTAAAAAISEAAGSPLPKAATLVKAEARTHGCGDSTVV
jgi:ABC-type multidrug transport system ATPase subunit